jgi:hypothetical protein
MFIQALVPSTPIATLRDSVRAFAAPQSIQPGFAAPATAEASFAVQTVQSDIGDLSDEDADKHDDCPPTPLLVCYLLSTSSLFLFSPACALR